MLIHDKTKLKDPEKSTYSQRFILSHRCSKIQSETGREGFITMSHDPDSLKRHTTLEKGYPLTIYISDT